MICRTIMTIIIPYIRNLFYFFCPRIHPWLDTFKFILTNSPPCPTSYYIDVRKFFKISLCSFIILCFLIYNYSSTVILSVCEESYILLSSDLPVSICSKFGRYSFMILTTSSFVVPSAKATSSFSKSLSTAALSGIFLPVMTPREVNLS